MTATWPAWMTAFREKPSGEVAPDADERVRPSARPPSMADALRDAGFYAACDEVEAGLRR